MDMLNVASTGVYTILALIVNFKENTCKKWTSSPKISCHLERSVVTLKLRKEYLNAVTYNTPVLLRIKYWTIWFIERYSMSTYAGVTNCQKTVQFFLAHPVIWRLALLYIARPEHSRPRPQAQGQGQRITRPRNLALRPRPRINIPVGHTCCYKLSRRSEGCLCLPKHFSDDVGDAVDRVCNGQFRSFIYLQSDVAMSTKLNFLYVNLVKTPVICTACSIFLYLLEASRRWFQIYCSNLQWLFIYL